VKKILMTVKELSVALGISEKSIRRAYWKGQLPGERICRLILFDVEVVRQVMRANGAPRQRAQGAVRVGASRPRGTRVRPR
jgi:hypothetical protein